MGASAGHADQMVRILRGGASARGMKVMWLITYPLKFIDDQSERRDKALRELGLQQVAS